MLEHTHLSNKEVAEALGFSDAFHFSRRFKQMTGTAPRAFRSQSKEFGEKA